MAALQYGWKTSNNGGLGNKRRYREGGSPWRCVRPLWSKHLAVHGFSWPSDSLFRNVSNVRVLFLHSALDPSVQSHSASHAGLKCTQWPLYKNTVIKPVTEFYRQFISKQDCICITSLNHSNSLHGVLNNVCFSSHRDNERSGKTERLWTSAQETMFPLTETVIS